MAVVLQRRPTWQRRSSGITETAPGVCVTVPDDTDGTTAAGDVDRNAAPGEFRLTDLEGKEQTLGAYRGKLILLNFFASW